jgi:prepilin-type N-terminal cleavage/methylation domain-containing protein
MTIHLDAARAGPESPSAAAAWPLPAATAGFSLPELVFVMVILGILTSMVAPLVTPGRFRTDTALQEMALTLNAAQRLAVLRQHDVVVTFALSDRTFRLLQDANNNGQSDQGEESSLKTLPETVGYGSGSVPALPDGAGPVSFQTGDADPTLTFHRNGSASASGVIYLRPLEGSMAQSPEAVRALTVERSTGSIRCFSYRTGSWESSC